MAAPIEPPVKKSPFNHSHTHPTPSEYEFLGLSKKTTCLQGRVAEWPSGHVAEMFNFGRTATATAT